jgi:hypothetical protein
MKQIKAHEMKLKQPQHEIRLNPKSTPRSKMNKTNKKHKKGGHLQRNNNMINLGSKANKQVNTFDMPRKATSSVKATSL